MPYSFPEFDRKIGLSAAHMPPAIVAAELRTLRDGLDRIGVLTAEHIQIAEAHLVERERDTLHQLRDGQRTFTEHQQALVAYLHLIGVGHDRALANIQKIELRRRPKRDEPSRITRDDIVVFAKVSKIEWDMRMLGIASMEALLTRYLREGADVESIVAGHEAHLRSVAEMQQLLGASRVVSYWDWSRGGMPLKPLVIMLGGDDTFKAGSQFLNGTYTIGVNSDVQNSVGAHLRLRMEQVPEALARLESGSFHIEEWTRLSVTINGGLPVLALDELYVGEVEAKFTSRATVEQNESEPIRAKGSGIVIATGSGATGWLRAATQSRYSGRNLWPRTAKHAEFSFREPYGDVVSFPDNGVLREGEEILIRSSHSKAGIISPDCIVDLPFPRGKVARVSLGMPLKVMSF